MKKFLMFQGVGANAGKTVFTRSLVRLLNNRGMKVAPFKPVSVGEKFENRNGLLLDKRMWILTEAARCKAQVYNAPIQIIKGTGNVGRLFIGQEEVGEVEIYAKDIALLHKLPKETLDLIKSTIKKSLEKLKEEYEMIIIEGSGSPIDLGEEDIANYYSAKISQSPIILVGNVSAGGVLASLHGTLLNFPKDLYQNIIGFAFNGVGFGKEIATKQAQFLAKSININYLGGFPHCEIYDEIPEGETSSLLSAEAEYEYLSNHFEKSFNLENILETIDFKVTEKSGN